MAKDITALVLVCTLSRSPASPARSCWAAGSSKSSVRLASRVSWSAGSTYGKVALVGVVGNEDGAHHTVAECLQALNDTGFSVAANAGTYWVGEAMHTTDYKDLHPSPEETTSATTSAVANAVHLARLLNDAPYPPS